MPTTSPESSSTRNIVRPVAIARDGTIPQTRTRFTRATRTFPTNWQDWRRYGGGDEREVLGRRPGTRPPLRCAESAISYAPRRALFIGSKWSGAVERRRRGDFFVFFTTRRAFGACFLTCSGTGRYRHAVRFPVRLTAKPRSRWRTFTSSTRRRRSRPSRRSSSA